MTYGESGCKNSTSKYALVIRPIYYQNCHRGYLMRGNFFRASFYSNNK